MKGDKKVIDYLNDALRHELTAVNQYWLHYRLFDNWGVNALAAKWRAEAIEEMQHADKLIDRIIFLEGFPNMQTLDALHIGKNPKEVAENDLQLEIIARTSIRRPRPTATRPRIMRRATCSKASSRTKNTISTSWRPSSTLSAGSGSSSIRSTISASRKKPD